MVPGRRSGSTYHLLPRVQRPAARRRCATTARPTRHCKTAWFTKPRRKRRAKGAVRNYRIVSSPILNASGEVTAAIEMVEDITERLSLESQFRQAQKMEAVGRLAGGVAHDFNNMLGVILGYTELALDKVDPARAAPCRPQGNPEGRQAFRGSDPPIAGLCPQADDRPQGARPERDRGGHAQDAAAADRRGHRSGLAAGLEPVAGQDGPLPDRPDPGQSVRQRPGRHRRRRQDHHRNGKRHL